MKDLYIWSLDKIRKDSSMSVWMEERRDEWTPLISSKIKLLLEGSAFIVFCDEERAWFEEYFLLNINRSDNARPILPFFSLKSMFKNLDEINTREGTALLEDMLTLAFPNGYIFFYVGRGNNVLANIAKGSENSLMWLVDERAENAFYMDGSDDALDIKFIQLFKLFDASVSAALFDEVVL
ncbi:MAG: hypothetical protein GX282_02110 [Campylobacteraceae bacterium]|nr:hypothetical protein [Campylobacteraceae bacterium]